MESVNPCCFCLLRSPYIDLKTPYTRLGVTATYSEMFEDCFKIQLALDNEDDCGICEVCVGRLQDASDFKLQVQHSQAALRARLERRRLTDEGPIIKTETNDGDVTIKGEILIHVEPAIKTEPVDDTEKLVAPSNKGSILSSPSVSVEYNERKNDPNTTLSTLEAQGDEANLSYGTKENSSLLRPMSPDPLDLYNTISEALDSDVEFDKYGEKNKEHDYKGTLNEKQDVTNDMDPLRNDKTHSPNANNSVIDNKRKVISDDENDSRSTDESHVDYVVDQEQSNPSVSRPKVGRKRKHQEHTLAQAKKRKYANLPYHGKKKYNESKEFRNYKCSCNRLCYLDVSREKRQQEFEKFSSLGSYEAQLLYILSCVTQITKKRAYATKTQNNKPRQFSRKYTISGITVCRDMFINNFQISTKKIDVALKKNQTGQLKDQRGLSSGGWNRVAPEHTQIITDVIDSLPKYESHYSERLFLKPGMTVQKIYDLYLEKLTNTFGRTTRPASFAKLKRIFLANYNLHFKSHKKDTCSRCDKLVNKINTSSEAERVALKQEQEEHLRRAEDLRNLMKDDLLRAKSDESFECLTFDLEKTLPLPRIPTSIVSYKRQLWLYNCGIHKGSNEVGHCFVWIEGEAGRGAQEVGSCLIKFIENDIDRKVEHLALWSDCCGGQNRNIKIVLMLKTILKSHPTLKTISINYLESGHTGLPKGTDFSKIETQLKFNERIYTADEYINVIKSVKTKNSLEVHRMEKDDFKSTKNIEKKITNRKLFVDKTQVTWQQTKQILLKKEDVHSIFMKTEINGEFHELNVEKKLKGCPLEISEDDFALLWPNGKEIPQLKLDDLTSMFDLIPKDQLGFYKSLRGNCDLVDDVDGFGGPPDFNLDNEEIIEKI